MIGNYDKRPLGQNCPCFVPYHIKTKKSNEPTPDDEYGESFFSPTRFELNNPKKRVKKQGKYKKNYGNI